MTEHFDDLGHLSNRIDRALLEEGYKEVTVTTKSGKQYTFVLRNGEIRTK
jgi:hypothetical protein